MVSIWWVLAAFVIGGYAGAVLVALMSMARISDEHAIEKCRAMRIVAASGADRTSDVAIARDAHQRVQQLAS